MCLEDEQVKNSPICGRNFAAMRLFFICINQQLEILFPFFLVDFLIIFLFFKPEPAY